MLTLKNQAAPAFTIDMLRDECKVIERRGGDLADLKKGFSKLHRLLKKMPVPAGDTLADLKKTRESRGRL